MRVIDGDLVSVSAARASRRGREQRVDVEREQDLVSAAATIELNPRERSRPM
jgi:hypothetical protein